MRKILISLTAIAFLVSCQQTLSDSARESIEKEITSITEATFNFFNEGDTSSMYLSFSDDFTGLSAGELSIVPEKWEQYKAKAKERFTTDAPLSFKITDSRIDVLSPTVVNHHILYNRKIVLAEDMTPQNYFACTWTYVLEAEGWKIRSSHNSYPEEYFRAVEGDSLFVALLDVKAESKEEFERLSHEMLFDKISEADPQAKYISTLFRILHPTEANEDGTYTYLAMFDPAYSGKYDFTTKNLYSKIYGEEKGIELNEKFAATLAGPQRSYFMIQSKQ